MGGGFITPTRLFSFFNTLTKDQGTLQCLLVHFLLKGIQTGIKECATTSIQEL